METFIIPASKNSPEIILDPENRDFRFTGLSIPENASAFYEPVIQWLRRNMIHVPDGSTFSFNLPYFNSSSLKAIYLVLMEIKRGTELGRTFPVTWAVDDDDEFMHEAADTFSEMLGMPLIVVNNDQAA